MAAAVALHAHHGVRARLVHIAVDYVEPRLALIQAHLEVGEASAVVVGRAPLYVEYPVGRAARYRRIYSAASRAARIARVQVVPLWEDGEVIAQVGQAIRLKSGEIAQELQRA